MDVLHDSSWRQWFNIAKTYKVPEYVMNHEVMDKNAAADLDDTLFADAGKRMFPLDSKANTWLSAAYFNENRDNIDAEVRPIIENNIKTAAVVWGITDEVNDVLSTRHVEVSPEDDVHNYGFIDSNGHTYFPLFDEEGVKRASEFFDKFKDSLPTEVRSSLAKTIVKKAGDYNIEIHTSVIRNAGIGLPVKIDIADHLLDRAYLTKDAECATVIASMIKTVAACQPEELVENLDKLAHVIEQLDIVNGMDKEYGKSIVHPFDFVYSMVPYEAISFIKDAMPLHQYTFSVEKLAKVDPDVFKAALGEEIFKSISNPDGSLNADKMAEVLPTLPRSDKITLEEHIVASCE